MRTLLSILLVSLMVYQVSCVAYRRTTKATTEKTTVETTSETETTTTSAPSTRPTLVRSSRRRSTLKGKVGMAHQQAAKKPFNLLAALFNLNRPAYHSPSKQADTGAPPAPGDPAAAPPMTLEKLQQMLTLLAKLQGGTAAAGATAKPAGNLAAAAAAGGASS